MTSAPAPVASSNPPTLDVSDTKPVPFTRLMMVEVRKMVDTRSGFWLLLVTGFLLAVVAGIALLVIGLNDVTPSAFDWSQILTIPLSLLLPVFAILTVTSEWSQRSGLVTFTLEPHRIRVLAAKLAAVVILVLAVMVLAIVLGAIGNVVGAALGGYDVRWNLEVTTLLATLLVQLLFFFMAFAFGVAILNTPGSIAIFYVVALLLPLLVYSTLFAFFGWAEDVIPWIDLQFGTAPLLEPGRDLEFIDIARMVVVTFIWIVAPMAIGTRRVLKSEPK